MNPAQQIMEAHVSRFRSEIMDELKLTTNDASKDILIVIHDQLPYVKICIDSILENTKNFHLYLWDNASQPETEAYLKELMYKLPDQVSIMRSDINLGFIEPNNEMISWGKSDYIILLNSDTKVFDGWDRAMIGFLQNNDNVAQVGYLGGILDESGKGIRADFGYNIDYVSGFCSCIKRILYKEVGLFDKKLKFAYCEDADFSLRLKSAGHQVYALHLMLVHHYENKTIQAVQSEGSIDVWSTFTHNHEYLKEKWQEYLKHNRIEVKEIENLQKNIH